MRTKIRDAGQVIGSVRRPYAQKFMAAVAAFNLLRALTALNEQKQRSDNALAVIEAQQASLEQTKRQLLAERATLERETCVLINAAGRFVRKLGEPA